MHVLSILNHAITVSMWPFPNEFVSPILLLSSRLSFLTNMKWTWYLMCTSTHKSLWNQLASNVCKIYVKLDELCLHFLLAVSICNIYPYQTMPYFSPPICDFDFGTHWSDWFELHCVMNKTNRSSRAHLLKSLHWNPVILLPKSSHFIHFINTWCFTTTWATTIKTSVWKPKTSPILVLPSIHDWDLPLSK